MVNDVATIFEDNYSFIFHYCLRRVDDWHTAEDITGATFERLMALWPHDHPRELLIRVAHHKVSNHWRANRQRRTWAFVDVFDLENEDRYPVLAIDGEMSHVDEDCDTAQLAPRLHAALATLSESDRQIIMWRYVDLLSPKEIAARLGVSADAYGHRQSLILYKLAKRMAPQPTCLICDAPVQGRGLCRVHLDQATRTTARIPMLPPIRTPRSAAPVCQECGAPAHLRGLCVAHYRQRRRQERKQVRQEVLK